MKIKRIAGALIITVLISCSSAKKGLLSGIQKAKAIDSLLLVRSLPVTISNSSSFKNDIRELLEDSLKAKQYKCLTKMTALAMYNNRKNETGPPYMQSLALFPCTNETGNCVGVKRLNYPDAGKQRIWMFEYEDKEPISHFVNRIIDSVTSHQNLK